MGRQQGSKVDEVIVVQSRVSRKVHDRLMQLAKSDRRSMASYVALLLERHVEVDVPAGGKTQGR
jgi:hypothetical protein